MPGLLWPVQGPITSPFGYRSGVNPLAATDFHTGIDFGVPIGTPVYATHSGIYRTEQNYGGGTMIVGSGGGGYQTVYAHLSRSTVGTGRYVQAGDLIGYSGASGHAVTGPHLHYEVKRNGQHLDPRYAMPNGMTGMMGLVFPQFQYDASTAGLQQKQQLADIRRGMAEQRRFEIDRSRGILGEYATIARSQRPANRYGIDNAPRTSRRRSTSVRSSRFAT